MRIGTELYSGPPETELLQKCRDDKEFMETVLGRMNFNDKDRGRKMHRLHFTVLLVFKLMQHRL